MKESPRATPPLRNSPKTEPSRAFLSSTSGLLQTGDVNKFGLRWDAWCDGSQDVRGVFVSEHAWEAFDESTYAHLEIATRLLEQVRLSRRFILLLYSERAGSSLTLQQEALATTFLELEVFQAIVLNKPFFLLVHESFNASNVSRYLDVLDTCLPGWRDRVSDKLNSAATLSAIRAITRGKGPEWEVRAVGRMGPTTHLQLLHKRDPHFTGGDHPVAHFMQIDRATWTRSRQVNERAIIELLNSRRVEDKFQDNDRRLALAWMLARELMAAPLLDAEGRLIQHDPTMLAGWNAALVDWHSAASWHGLHSHIYFGTLPTVNTLAAVRQHIRREPQQDFAGNFAEQPRGLYSTSYYSLAKRVPPENRAEVLRFAKDALFDGKSERDVLTTPDDLNMLGSIALASDQSTDATALFERSLSLLQASDAPPNEVGMVLCELAFARMATGDLSRAAAEAREGVRMLRRNDEEGRPVIDGFFVRGTFKSAAVHVRARKIGTAASMYWEAYTASRRSNYDDQLAQWGPAALMTRAVDGASWNLVLQVLGLTTRRAKL